MTTDDINELREEIQQRNQKAKRITADYQREMEAAWNRWRMAMGKWKEGWHPTSRVKYPKPRYMKTYSCGESYIWQFNKVDLYCYLLELRADVLCEERRLQEKYERPLHS